MDDVWADAGSGIDAAESVFDRGRKDPGDVQQSGGLSDTGAGGGERGAGVSGDDGEAAEKGAAAGGGGAHGYVAGIRAAGGLLAGVLRRGIPAGCGWKRGTDERIPAAGRGPAGGGRCGRWGMDAGIFPVSGAAAGEAGGRRPRRLSAGMRWGCGLLRGGTAGGAG